MVRDDKFLGKKIYNEKNRMKSKKMRGRWEKKERERKGSAYGSGVCNWKRRKWGNEFYKERNKKKMKGKKKRK